MVFRNAQFRSLAARIRGFRSGHRLKGRVERVERGSIHGWAFDPSAPDRRLDIEIRIDGVAAVSCVADRARGDLARSGIGDGSHGFQAELPAHFRDGQAHRVQAFERESGWELPSASTEVMLERGPAAGALPKPVRFAGGRALSAFIAPVAAEDGVADADGAEGDAIVNGRFARWSAPFRQTLSHQAIQLADGWFLEGKKPNPKVSAWLTEVITRDLQTGEEGALSYGVSVFGPLPGKYARLLTALNVEAFVSSSPKRLTFYSRPASATQQHPALAAPQISAIANVSIVARTMVAGPDDASADRRLCVLAKKLRVPAAGKSFAIDLTAEQVQAVLSEAAAKESVLLLAFEFSTFADCVIAEVSLTDAPKQDRWTNDASDRPSLEDDNIAAQIGAVRGLEHWLAPDPVPAPIARHGGRLLSLSAAKWRWPPRPGRSLEIVICVHDAAEETLDCLDSVKRCTTVPHIVTIVDDGSTGSTRAQLRSYVEGAPWMRLIEFDEQMGYTKAANAGLSAATADWLVLLNSDTIVTRGWIEGLFEVVDARPDVALVGPLSNAASWQSVPDVQDAAARWKVNSIPAGMTIDEMAALVAEMSPRQFPEVPLLNGFCTMMRRSAVEELGFLDEVNFPQGYGEENDLCLRARKAGHRLALADHVYVYHVKSASFGSQRRNQLSKRGTERLLAKHPDADMQKLQQEMAELGALAELRKSLRRRLSQASQSASSEVA